MNTLNNICCLFMALSIFCVTINVLNFVNLSLVDGAEAVFISVAIYPIIDILIPRIPLHFTNRDWHRIMPCIFEKVHDHIRVRNTVKVLGQGICTVIICLITIVTISWFHDGSDTNIGSAVIFGTNDQTKGSNPMEPDQRSQSKGLNSSEPIPTECTFCIRWTGHQYHGLTRLFFTMMPKPECWDEHSNASLTVSNETTVSLTELQGKLSEIFRGQVAYHNYSEGTCKTVWTDHMWGNSRLTQPVPERIASLLPKYTQFVRRQLGLSDHEQVAVAVDDVLRVVVVNRTSNRIFRDGDRFQRVLESRDTAQDKESGHFKVDIVEFRKSMSLKQQIESLTEPTPTFIITTHGAGNANFLFVDSMTATNTHFIEVCPPYTHCLCRNDTNAGDKPPQTDLCPWYFHYSLKPLNLSYWAYAVEDPQLSCHQYCADNMGVGDRRKPLLYVKYLTVNPQSLRMMMRSILESPISSRTIGPNSDRIRVHHVDFGAEIRGLYSDLAHRDAMRGLPVPESKQD